MKESDNWPGRRRCRSDILDRWRAEALAATLGLEFDVTSPEVPVLWHWIYFLDIPRREAIGADGHPAQGDFIPPVPNPRRVFGGARIDYFRPMHFNREATLIESVKSTVGKTGGSGKIYVVTLSCQYYQGDKLCVSEERDLIYLPQARTPARPSTRRITDDFESASPPCSIDRVTLFRFSALTFNAHRIHYDDRYARDVEGHDDLVVHGPLLAVLLSEYVRAIRRVEQQRLSFRAVQPVYVDQSFRICATGESDGHLRLVACKGQGEVAMTATATLRC